MNIFQEECESCPCDLSSSNALCLDLGLSVSVVIKFSLDLIPFKFGGKPEEE
jgi:hypothetical protein